MWTCTLAEFVGSSAPPKAAIFAYLGETNVNADSMGQTMYFIDRYMDKFFNAGKSLPKPTPNTK